MVIGAIQVKETTTIITTGEIAALTVNKIIVPTVNSSNSSINNKIKNQIVNQIINQIANRITNLLITTEKPSTLTRYNLCDKSTETNTVNDVTDLLYMLIDYKIIDMCITAKV
jgi:hypothetical protein